jgi:hypothetical protein
LNAGFVNVKPVTVATERLSFAAPHGATDSGAMTAQVFGTVYRLGSVIGLLVLLWSYSRGVLAIESDTDRWVLVDTGAATLSVMQGGQPHLVLNDIAIGRYGASVDRLRGDNTTPLGRFRVTAIRNDSRFHRFVALDYPDLPRAMRAWQQGLIERQDWDAIVIAHAHGRPPPQDTRLGGHIGIHGLGRADSRMHRLFHWTRGCVALTDAQIDRLLDWLEVGMVVEIR